MTGCKDEKMVVDTNQEIAQRTWSYIDKIKVPVTIPDSFKGYNVFLNLRLSGDYKYSNIFILIHHFISVIILNLFHLLPYILFIFKSLF